MRQTGFDRLCGLANAVMRRLTREGEELFAATNTWIIWRLAATKLATLLGAL